MRENVNERGLAVEARDIVKRFGRRGEVRAIDGVTVSVEPGELLVLLGPSGCGKTTLLRCLSGLETPDEGTIQLGGRTVFDASTHTNVPTHHRDIGMVFQSYALWPHMTVARNIAYPLRARQKRDALRANRVDEMLQVVRCSELRGRYPGQLSGGQQQRIALARGLASHPALMLLDEPLSNLDALLRQDLRSELRLIHSRLRFAGIYVTHDQVEAFSLGTRVAVMRKGTIEQLAVPEEVWARPASPYVADFLGIRNHWKVARSESTWHGPYGPIIGDVAAVAAVAETPPGDYLLYARPQDLDLCENARRDVASDDCVVLGEGQVVESLFAGEKVEYIVRVGDERVYVERPQSAPRLASSTAVRIELRRGRGLLYRDDQLVQQQPAITNDDPLPTALFAAARDREPQSTSPIEVHPT